MTDRLTTGELYRALAALIDETGSKELECRKYLQYAKEYLFKETVEDFVYVETEYRGHVGDSDYVISGTVLDESGFKCVRAYIWELKAPQCYIFEKDTENRVRPSSDLIQAENQLLHYYHEQRGSDDFRRDFKITHPDDVRFGGIIIGCTKKWIRGDYGEEKKGNLYEKAVNIRRKYFYDKVGIRLITWNTILDQIYPGRIKSIKEKGERKEVATPVISGDATAIYSVRVEAK